MSMVRRTWTKAGSWWRLGAAVALGAWLGACASGSGQGAGSAGSAVRVRTEPAAEAAEPVAAEPVAVEPSPEVEALFADLEAQVQEFEAGLEMILAGQQVLGRERVAAAATAMRSGTLECSRRPGCDLDVFFAAYDYLLDEQTAALEGQSSRLVESETAPETAEVEEPGTRDYRAEAAPPEEIERTIDLFRGTDLRELITLNGPVQAALDDWLTWMRPDLMSAWHNYQYLRPVMAPLYEEAGLPEALLFGMLATESGGKVHSYSRAGAAGPLQFMPATGRVYGLYEVDGFDLRLDPAAATRANTAYLSAQLRRFNNDLEKVLAAYNGGEGRMGRIQRSYGNTSFWDRRVYYQFPRETRTYVPRVLAAAWLFLEPGLYNLELPRLDTRTVGISPRQPISIGELTICLGQEGNPHGWFRTLRNLNPRVEPDERIEPGRSIVMPAGLVEAYERRCLEGEVVARARELHDANYPPTPEMIPYIVRQGDTLGRIASRYPCVGIRELADLNRISPPRYLIRIGQTLRIPACQ